MCLVITLLSSILDIFLLSSMVGHKEFSTKKSGLCFLLTPEIFIWSFGVIWHLFFLLFLPSWQMNYTTSFSATNNSFPCALCYQESIFQSMRKSRQRAQSPLLHKHSLNTRSLPNAYQLSSRNVLWVTSSRPHIYPAPSAFSSGYSVTLLSFNLQLHFSL